MARGRHAVAEQFDVFLSYNRLDRQVVEPLAEALLERKLKVFKDDWYLRPGEFWPTALENKLNASAAVAVTISRNGLSGWQQREVAAALDRYSREEKAGRLAPPVIPVLLEDGSDRQAGLAFLLQHTWVEGWDPRAADLIAGAVRGKAPAELYDEGHPDPRTRICPYRGLGVFREEDAGFYFGREPDVREAGGGGRLLRWSPWSAPRAAASPHWPAPAWSRACAARGTGDVAGGHDGAGKRSLSRPGAGAVAAARARPVSHLVQGHHR